MGSAILFGVCCVCEEEQVAEEAEWAALEAEGGDEVEEDEGVGEDAAPQ